MSWLSSHNATVAGGILEIVTEAISFLGGAIAEAIEPAWIIAIVLVALAWYGSKLVADRLRPQLEAQVLRPSVTNAALLTARVLVVVVSLIPIAGLIGFRPRNILLSVTVLSVVAGVILAPVAQSYISGFFVVLNRPYEVGDMIELVDEETRGYVEDITLRYTKIFTLENTFLVIPNETIRERDVCNLSAEDERRRLSVLVEVTYEGDLESACTLLEDCAREVEGVITGGPDIRVGSSRYSAKPKTFVREFAADGIVLDLRFWVSQPYQTIGVQSGVYRSIWRDLQDPAVNVEVAYPHTHLVFDETSGRARAHTQGQVSVDLEDDGTTGHAGSSGERRTDRNHTREWRGYVGS